MALPALRQYHDDFRECDRGDLHQQVFPHFDSGGNGADRIESRKEGLNAFSGPEGRFGASVHPKKQRRWRMRRVPFVTQCWGCQSQGLTVSYES